MIEPGQQHAEEIRAGDKVGHRYKIGRVGHVDQLLSGAQVSSRPASMPTMTRSAVAY